MSRHVFLTLLVIVALTSCGKHETAAPKYPHAPVILISIDTLRSDHLPAYGYKGVSTPAIDSLRADGILYRHAYAHVPMTLPSHVSILTGLLPYQNGVRNNAGYRLDAQKHDSLPAMLKRAGYATGGAVSAYVLRGDTGLRSIFDFYDDDVAGAATGGGIGDVSRPGSITGGIAEQWVSAHHTEPFFFFLHLFEPHWPYEAPEPFRSGISNPYDAEIAAADSVVGHFLERLKSLGIYDRAIIIFLSDHGEGLGDHGEGEHGVFLYRESIQVPLIVKLPKSERRGTAVDAPVELIDVMPTVAALTAAKPASALPGSSLLAPQPGRRIYSETLLPRIHFGWSDLRSLIDARFHYIEAPRSELYDVGADPGERSNIAEVQRRVYAEMRNALHESDAAFTAPAPVDPEEARKLAALGYIGQTRTGTDGAELPDPKDRIADLEQLKAGSALERSGKIAEAEAAYASLAHRNPRFADAWLRLADVQERQGRIEEALASCKRAIDVAPVLAPDLALVVGRLLLRSGRLDEAAAHAELAMKPSPGAAHHLLGRIALARGDVRTAESEARQSMSDSAQRSAGAVLLAQVWTAQGRLTEALSLLDQTKSSAREPVRDLQATRGDILARLERASEAEAAFREEIRLFPENTTAYSRLALLYVVIGRGRDAEALLETMFDRSRSTASAKLAAGVWKAAGNAAAAARWEQRAASAR